MLRVAGALPLGVLLLLLTQRGAVALALAFARSAEIPSSATADASPAAPASDAAAVPALPAVEVEVARARVRLLSFLSLRL